MLSVGITILVRRRSGMQAPYEPTNIFYYKVTDNQSGIAKLGFLAEKGNFTQLEWQKIVPDDRYNWLTEGIYSEFSTFLKMGTRAFRNLAE
jgi:predicted helicase